MSLTFSCALAALLTGNVPLPGTSSVTVPMQPPSVCRTCHSGFAEESPYDSWLGSPMAFAAKDPLFLSALTEAEKDLPGVGDLCLRCHVPEGWLQGRCAETSGLLLGPEDTGVTCAACHRMTPSPWQRNGQYNVADDLVYRGDLEMPAAPHQTRTSTFTPSSELCGACHDLRNPLVMRRELDGTPTRQPFPEQTTYTEWRMSAFAAEGQSCQSCHMPKDEGVVGMGGPIRTDRSAHDLVGGNVFLLGAIAFLEPGLGVQAQLERGKVKAREMLRSAATLELLDPPPSVARGQAVELILRVTNTSGHKLPTGYPEGRRVWLQLQSPALGLDLGRYDATRGEPIRPAALYHTVQGRYGVGPGHRLVLNDAIFYDSRLPPRGFVSTATTAPVGKIYPEVSPGVLAHYDDVVVTATVPCDAGAVASLEATLWYQSVTRAYVEALVAENGLHPRARRLESAFAEADPGPLEVTRLTAQLPIDPTSSCDPPDAGVADSGARPDASAQDAGMTADAAPPSPPPPEDEGGCSCRSGSGSERGWAGGLIATALLWMGSRRGRRKRRG